MFKTKYRAAAAALQSAAEAQQSAARMEEQAREAEARAAAMEAESVEALVSDPGQAESISRTIDAQRRLSAAYRTKAAQQRVSSAQILRQAIALDARDPTAAAEAKAKEAQALQGRIDALLNQLEEFAGVAYEVAPLGKDFEGNVIGWPGTRAEDLAGEAELLRVQAAASRYYELNGTAPGTVEHLNEMPGASYGAFALGSWQLRRGEHWSPLLRAVVDGTALTGSSLDA